MRKTIGMASFEQPQAADNCTRHMDFDEADA